MLKSKAVFYNYLPQPLLVIIVLSSTNYFFNYLPYKYVYFINIVIVTIFSLCFEYIFPWKIYKSERKEVLSSIFLSVINLTFTRELGKFLFILLATNFLTDKRILPQEYFSQNLEVSLFLHVIVGFIVSEFLKYWIHRFQHKISFLWRYHKVHHSVESVAYHNVFRSHPIDFFLRIVLPAGLVSFSGLPFKAVIYIFSIDLALGSLSHLKFGLSQKYYNYIFSTPELHRWHHAKNKVDSDCNFGVSLIIFDILFKTIRLPSESSLYPQKLGVEE